MAAKVFAAPKGDGVPEPSRIRPITVLSQIYRVWAQVVCRQALRCLGVSMTHDITGLLPGRGAFLAAYHTQWFFEQAHFQQESCAGVTLDLVKCFNAINRPRGIAILSRLGLPAEILHMWAQSLHKLSRRWEVCGQCSETVASSCGFPEGDVFSVLVMLGVAQCWTLACRQHTSDSTLLSAYADNWSWAVKNIEELGPILEVTLLWTRIIGLQVDWSKTWWWSSHHSLARHIQSVFQSRSLPAVERVLAASDLGCPLRYQGAVRMCKLHSRLAKAKERLARLKHHATDLDAKAKVISASVYPVAFHGAELCPIGTAHTRSLRHHVAEALVGPSESMCAALVTLCASRFVRDPELQVILNACAAARRFLFRQNEAVVTQFLSIAARYFPRANTSKGPATSFKAYISRLGWTIDLSGHLQVTAFIRIHLLWSPWKTIVMFAERSWQDRLLTLHSHRASLANFPNVDQHLTRQTLDNFSPEDRRLLVREIGGAFQTRVQQAIWDSQVTPECQWCGQPDTKHHRFFSCTATRTVREPFQELVTHLDSFDCLWPELPVLFEDTKGEFRLTFQYNLQEGQPPAELIQNLISCIDEQNPLHLYTDGSCQSPTMPTLRFAGYSVVIDSCRSDSERIWHAHRYKETGIWPTTLHVILQELCPQSQVRWSQSLLGWRPSLLGWRSSLLG